MATKDKLTGAYNLHTYDDEDSLLSRVDNALFRAKTKGKDRLEREL